MTRTFDNHTLIKVSPTSHCKLSDWVFRSGISISLLTCRSDLRVSKWRLHVQIVLRANETSPFHFQTFVRYTFIVYDIRLTSGWYQSRFRSLHRIYVFHAPLMQQKGKHYVKYFRLIQINNAIFETLVAIYPIFIAVGLRQN